MPQPALSGDDFREWVALGEAAIANYDPDLWVVMQKVIEVPDARISSEEFNDKFITFQQRFEALCDAEEQSMGQSSLPPEKVQRHATNHLDILDQIHHVHFHVMQNGTQTARQIHELLVAEIFQHLIDFHMNYDY